MRLPGPSNVSSANQYTPKVNVRHLIYLQELGLPNVEGNAGVGRWHGQPLVTEARPKAQEVVRAGKAPEDNGTYTNGKINNEQKKINHGVKHEKAEKKYMEAGYK